MSNVFHIEGFNLDADSFSDYYALLEVLGICSGHIDEEPSVEEIPNVSLKIYDCPKECTLEEAQNNFICNVIGLMTIETQDYGYSEYTIEGFNVYSMKLGGHDIEDIIKEKCSKGKYLHILIEKVDGLEGLIKNVLGDDDG